ncbi:MAG TPA: MFS transporter [Chloroflexota bacterium]|nr:MFS transporter [Chloroflexota bacterium]
MTEPREGAIRRFYYGWVIVAVGALASGVGGFMATTPFSAFLTPMTRDLGWSHATLNGAQGVGSLVGGLVAPFAGRLVDRYGTRVLLSAAGVGLGVSMLICASVREPWQFFVGYGLGRVVFQGIIIVSASTAVANWFVRQRGRATGLALMGNAASVAITVPLIQHLSDTAGWRTAWLVLAVLAVVLLTPAAALFLRRRPEDLGLLPDGATPPAQASAAASAPSDVRPSNAGDRARARTVLAPAPDRPATASRAQPTGKAVASRPAGREASWRLGEALRTRAFWLLLGSSGLTGFTVAGVTTYQIPLLLHNGVAPGTAALMVSIYATCWTLGIAGWGFVVERIPARYGLAVIYMVSAVATVVLLGADSAGPAVLFALLYGVVVGGNSTLEAVIWADYYGRGSLGTIRGFGRPVTLTANALGPLATGLAIDAFGSYQPPFLGYAAASLGAAMLVLLARPPRRKRPNPPAPFPLREGGGRRMARSLPPSFIGKGGRGG